MQNTAQSLRYKISHRLFSPKCSVDIALPGGNHVRVKGFEDESVAQYWLEHEARNFLRKFGHWFDMFPEEKSESIEKPASETAAV